jgi:AcrR family transcriptional regulator
MESPFSRRRPGRPLSFDRDAALEKAMLLFWRHGYEGTSLADLTAAMGVTPPSIYAAFGDKKRLFLEAVDRYLSGPVPSEGIVRDATTAREAAWRLMTTAAAAFAGEATPPGCLLATAAASCSAASADVQADLKEIRLSLEARLREKIEDAIATGELTPEADAEALARLIIAVIQGMSSLARDGASRAKLTAIAEAAMRAWPDMPGHGLSMDGSRDPC